jgi:hypothetical protein
MFVNATKTFLISYMIYIASLIETKMPFSHFFLFAMF